MLNSQLILKSTKRSGKYEDAIINKLQAYFIKCGYETVSHARFDIAWGSILSDVDLLLIKNNQLILVEVKSSHDNLSRAKNQIRQIEDFVDLIYVATDYYPKKWPSRKAGRIVVKDDEVRILKEAKPLDKLPKLETLISLRRESLAKLLDKSENEIKRLTKFQLAILVREINQHDLKDRLKELVTCQ
ncbi:MAG: hypothetical protein KGI09_02465 [Thaumarchaeota archaeon]|nr:hypothetical protein [Nitrososphaerota archaeon]